MPGQAPIYRLLPWLVLAVSLAATYLLWEHEQEHAAQQLRTVFDTRAHEINTRIEQRMQAYEQTLRAVQGLFAASVSVERKEFHDFVSSQQLAYLFPGTQSMGYAAAIPAALREQHIADVHKEGFPRYTITPEGERDLYAPIVYIEPFSARNLRAFGYDAYADPVRRAAMDEARDSGQATMTGMVTLVQEFEFDKQAGCILYLPVYKNGAPHNTLPERRANTLGWVSIALRMDDLMHGILHDTATEIDIEIYDGKVVDPPTSNPGNISELEHATYKTVMYNPDLYGDREETTSRFYVDTHLQIANHYWTITTHSLPRFEARMDKKMSTLIAYTGTGASVLLALFTWLLVYGHTRALRTAHTLTAESEKNKMLLHVASDGIYILDQEGKLVLTNDTLCRMLGYTPEEMHDMTVAQWNEKWTAEKVKAKITELLSRPEGVVFETRFRRSDGRFVEVEINAVSVEIEGRTMLYSSVRDITQRRESEEALRLAATVFNTVDEAVMVICLKGLIVTVNPAFSVITGYTSDEVIGKSPRILTAGAPTPTLLMEHPDFFEELWESLTAAGKWQGEVGNRRKDGEYYIVWLSINRVYDSQNRPIHYVAVFSDISARKATEEQMSYLAHYDALTELPNRTLFTDRLQQALTQAKRDKAHLALVYLDLDNFKPVNDTFGHHIGDLLLKEVAKRLQECKRESDTVSRIGGDEFIMLLPTIETELDAIVVADKILHALSQRFELDGHSLQLSTSIGIATYPEHGSDEKLLIKHADIAMYHAKKSGRNNVKLYQSELLESRQQ